MLFFFSSLSISINRASPFLCALNISIYRLINDDGPKIEAYDVGFYVDLIFCFCRDIVILCCDIAVSVATLLVYVMT